MTNEEVIKIYEATGDFMATVRKTGMKTFIVHKILLFNKKMTLEDKVKLTQGAQKHGAEAELLFQKMVPDAVPVNEIKVNNPYYDFVYKGITIDVKYCGVTKESTEADNHWKFGTSRKQKADFYFVFAEFEKGQVFDDCFMLLIPSTFITQKSTVNFRERSEIFKNFLIYEEELIETLDMYAEVIGEEGT